MTVKKVAIIAAAGAVLLAGALTLSMTLITRNKIEVTATETSAQNETEQEEGGVKTLENMENMPLYFDDARAFRGTGCRSEWVCGHSAG